jgi:hypothetical protein
MALGDTDGNFVDLIEYENKTQCSRKTLCSILSGIGC